MGWFGGCRMKPGDRVFMCGNHEIVGTVMAPFESTDQEFMYRPSKGDYDWFVLPDNWHTTWVPMYEIELEVLRSGS